MHKVIDLEGKTEIKDCFEFESKITSITFINASNVTSIGYYFLSDCHYLKSIYLGPLSNVTYIDDGFLYGCISLEIINLRPFLKVTSIGKCFLYGCKSLKKIKYPDTSFWDEWRKKNA